MMYSMRLQNVKSKNIPVKYDILEENNRKTHWKVNHTNKKDIQS